MLRINQLGGFGARRTGGSALAMLQALGLTGGLKLCLDAGDAASYPGSGQSWLDLSGNGHDFNRGSTSGSDASDPTFNGTAGRLSGGEYWSFDGGDYLTYDDANETWMQNLHKAGARWSVIQWLELPGSYADPVALFGDNGGTNNVGTGVHSTLVGTGGANDGKVTIRVVNGGSAVLNVQSTNALIATTGWHMFGLSIDAGVGVNGGLFFANGATQIFNASYSGPSAGNASQTFQICARGNANAPFGNGYRLGMFLMWEGAAPLTAGQFSAFFEATRWRFGA